MEPSDDYCLSSRILRITAMPEVDVGVSYRPGWLSLTPKRDMPAHEALQATGSSKKIPETALKKLSNT